VRCLSWLQPNIDHWNQSKHWISWWWYAQRNLVSCIEIFRYSNRVRNDANILKRVLTDNQINWLNQFKENLKYKFIKFSKLWKLPASIWNIQSKLLLEFCQKFNSWSLWWKLDSWTSWSYNWNFEQICCFGRLWNNLKSKWSICWK